jgi:hypothetical protein
MVMIVIVIIIIIILTVSFRLFTMHKIIKFVSQSTPKQTHALLHIFYKIVSALSSSFSSSSSMTLQSNANLRLLN